MPDRRYRIGFDIGGTFTDFALHDAQTGQLQIFKALTTPSDPSRGAVEGIKALLDNSGLGFSAIGEIIHGTTLVTNALIEGKGAPTALLTTRGFRDVLELGYEQRYDIYDLFLKYPAPLVPRKLRREIDERILSNGEVLTPLSADAVRREAEALHRAGVTAVAVCFLHSYRNPEHELSVGRLLAEEFPELSVSLSCEVVAELREYERVCTTVANAFVQPLMDGYLKTLEEKLSRGGFAGRLSLMLSSGGLATPDVARRFPIRMLESGPAGGALATALVSNKLQLPDLVSFDMGGTTAKASLIQDGKAHVAPMMEVARVHRFKKGSGFPVRAPVVEMIEIGAGGGSIAHLDEVGLIKVGPQSAGADPGPACYGLGGTAPTVTDANLVLGYLDPTFFLGGRMALDQPAAEAALEALGKQLGLDAVGTAWGIYNIVCENMAAAARAHIVEKGCDPRGFAIAAFGGAGPAHAAKVARIIGVKDVIIPPASGAASAIGFLAAPAGFETVRSQVVTVQDGLDVAALNALLAEVEAEARSQLRAASIPAGSETVLRSADMRVRGQIHEISVPLPDGPLDGSAAAKIRSAFIAVYQSLYRSVPPNAIIEALSWRVRVSGPAPDVALRPESAAEAASRAIKGRRRAFFGSGFLDATVYDRYALRPGDRIAGPAIIEERESTTIVPPSDHVTVDDQLNLHLAVGEAAPKVRTIGAELSLAEAVARIESDPIGLEIMWARLVNITDECWDAVVRTAFSLIMSDAQDFSVAIFDQGGRILAHSPRAQPVFNLCLPRAIEAILQRFRDDELRPGDVLITNDPWLASGHLYDVAIVTPVFHEGRLVGHIGAIGHVTDIGGTKETESAYELYDEGFQIPPMKLYREGRQNDDLIALLKENVRDQKQVVGDIHSLVGASSIGVERLREFLAEYALHDLQPLAKIFQDRSESAMREAIRQVPDGVYESEIHGLVGGAMQRLPVKVVVKHDEITIDLAGAPPEAGRGGTNCTLNYTTAHSVYPFKCLLTPGVRGNSGCYRPFTLRVPEGSILNCRKPASVRIRQNTGWYLGPNTFAALATAIPERVRAFSGLPGSSPFYGTNGDGAPFIDYLFAGGGQGGAAGSDGKSGLLYPIGSANTSIELFEIRTQLLVAEKQLACDSGGPGRHRGGLGQVVRVVKLLGDERPAQCGLHMPGMDIELQSMHGGRPGAPVEIKATETGMAEPHRLKTARLWTLCRSGDSIEIRTAGGHGYGDPLERSLDLIERDLEHEYVGRAQAEADYGCVFHPDGRIDRAQSEQNRQRLRETAAKAERDRAISAA